MRYEQIIEIQSQNRSEPHPTSASSGKAPPRPPPPPTQLIPYPPPRALHVTPYFRFSGVVCGSNTVLRAVLMSTSVSGLVMSHPNRPTADAASSAEPSAVLSRISGSTTSNPPTPASTSIFSLIAWVWNAFASSVARAMCVGVVSGVSTRALTVNVMPCCHDALVTAGAGRTSGHALRNGHQHVYDDSELSASQLAYNFTVLVLQTLKIPHPMSSESGGHTSHDYISNQRSHSSHTRSPIPRLLSFLANNVVGRCIIFPTAPRSSAPTEVDGLAEDVMGEHSVCVQWFLVSASQGSETACASSCLPKMAGDCVRITGRPGSTRSLHSQNTSEGDVGCLANRTHGDMGFFLHFLHTPIVRR